VGEAGAATTETCCSSQEATKLLANRSHSGWDNKMAELEAIHQEIAPQVNAMRLAGEQDDADALNAEFELSFLISGR
jgi:hypothetical protein